MNEKKHYRWLIAIVGASLAYDLWQLCGYAYCPACLQRIRRGKPHKCIWSKHHGI